MPSSRTCAATDAASAITSASDAVRARDAGRRQHHERLTAGGGGGVDDLHVVTDVARRDDGRLVRRAHRRRDREHDDGVGPVVEPATDDASRSRPARAPRW